MAINLYIYYIFKDQPHCEKYEIVKTNAIVTSHIAKDKVSVLVSHTSSNFSFGLQLITWNFSTSWQKNCQIEIKNSDAGQQILLTYSYMCCQYSLVHG